MRMAPLVTSGLRTSKLRLVHLFRQKRYVAYKRARGAEGTPRRAGQSIQMTENKGETYRDFALTPTCNACREIIAWRSDHPELQIESPGYLRVHWRSYASVSRLLQHRSHLEIIPLETRHVEEKITNAIALTNCGDFADAFRFLFARGSWAYPYLYSILQRSRKDGDSRKLTRGTAQL